MICSSVHLFRKRYFLL